MTQNLELIEQCLGWIRKEQEVDGSFKSFSSNENNEIGFEYHTTFFTSLILSSLAKVPQAQDVCKKAVDFLLTQKSENDAFNYWAASSPERTALPYPDDLDDTFCALAALYCFDSSLLKGGDLAKVIKILTHQEVGPGGPYKTWIVNTENPLWNDVDIAVNSNIGFFLAQQKSFLPNLNNFIEDKIIKADLNSQYYPSVYPVIYFISRYYQGSLKEILIKQLWSMKGNDNWGNILDQSLALNALWNFGCHELVKSEVLALIPRLIEVNRSYGFCFDPVKNKQRYFGGSCALNAALCVEILSKSAEALVVETDQTSALFSNMRDKTRQILSQSQGMQKDWIDLVLSEVESRKEDVYTSILPLLLSETFPKLDYSKVLQLGVYNCLGCIAYRFYDDRQDENLKNKNKETISLACIKSMNKIVESIGNQSLKDFSTVILKQMNEANDWEKNNLKKKIDGKILEIDCTPSFGNLSIIAEKSSGYVIASVGILCLANEGSKENIKVLITFFRHYIIARQLNDDAHDWEEDLNKGLISYPVTGILKKFFSNSIPNKLDIGTNINQLRKIFWNDVLPEIATDILFHINQAEIAISEMDFLKNKEIFSVMLVAPKNAAKTALEEYRQTKEFMAEYSKI